MQPLQYSRSPTLWIIWLFYPLSLSSLIYDISKGILLPSSDKLCSVGTLDKVVAYSGYPEIYSSSSDGLKWVCFYLKKGTEFNHRKLALQIKIRRMIPSKGTIILRQLLLDIQITTKYYRMRSTKLYEVRNLNVHVSEIILKKCYILIIKMSFIYMIKKNSAYFRCVNFLTKPD